LSKIHDELRYAEQFRHGSSVASGLRIQGQIVGSGDLIVDGTVEGPIQLTEGKLTVGKEGQVTGNVSASEVEVHGSVIGDVQAKNRVDIKSSGVVVGNLETVRMMIEDGAHYKGSIEIGVPSATKPKASAADAS
jgi:cytoskeletal protein CcmA (bactofilin family)